MTIALVHGNPEVATIWDDLRAVLGRDDVVALSPPGFGGPIPDGFGSTAPEYAEWLVAAVRSLPQPVHLIGHDWGGGHVINAMLLRPDVAASVTTDIAGCYAPGYAWHDMAQVWRTPGAGEEAIAAMASLPVDERVDMYEGLGMSPAAARACAGEVDRMGPSILALYRSNDEAAFVRASNEVVGLADRPELHVIIATEDGYTGGPDQAALTADAWGATIHRLDGLGHWWMMQDPERAAAVVRAIAGD